MAEEPTVSEAGTPPVVEPANVGNEGAAVAPNVGNEPSERPILPGQEIVYRNEDGTEAVVKVEDAIASHKKLQLGGVIDPKKLEDFQRWDGAMSGDPAKVAEYAQTLIPKVPPKPEVVIEDQQKTIDALRTDLEEVKRVLAGDIQPVTNQLRSVTDLQGIAAEVKNQAGDHPHLARLAEKKGPMVAAQAIRNRRGFYEQAAQREGTTLTKLSREIQKEVYVKIFKDVEDELASFAGVFGEPLTKVAVTTPAPPVNDQGSPDVQPGHVPARIQIGPDGRMLGEAPPAGAPPQAQPPAVPVVPAPGGAPGIQSDQGPKPFTLDALNETLKAERERLAGVV